MVPRVNVQTQSGSGTWTPGKNGGPATYSSNLNPTLTTAQNQADRTYRNATDRANPILSNPTINAGKLAAMPVNAGTTGQEAIMARLSPQIDRERNALHTQLVNWGLQPNSEAYRDAMRQQNERENDLLNQAAVSGLNLDMDARQQGLEEQVTMLNTPADVLNKLGARVGTAPGVPNAGSVGSAPNLTAAWDAAARANLNQQQLNNQREQWGVENARNQRLDTQGQNRWEDNYRRQSTSDWLNLGVEAARSADDVVNWLQEMGWWS